MIAQIEQLASKAKGRGDKEGQLIALTLLTLLAVLRRPRYRDVFALQLKQMLDFIESAERKKN